MRLFYLSTLTALCLLLISSCNKEVSPTPEKEGSPISHEFVFSDRAALLAEINTTESEAYHTRGASTENETQDTLYNALSDLVPNSKFRKCMTPDGELIVGDTVYSICKEGTYYAHKKDMQLLRDVRKANEGKITFRENELEKTFGTVKLYNTFGSDGVSEDEITEFTEADSETPYQTRGYWHQSFIDDFPYKYMGQKNAIVNFFQSGVGFNKDGVIKFRSNRRLLGALYSYNYLVYAECGVRAKIEKKNWAGWGKMKNWDRGTTIGWRGVLIQVGIPASTMKELMRKIRNDSNIDPYNAYNPTPIKNASALKFRGFKNEIYGVPYVLNRSGNIRDIKGELFRSVDALSENAQKFVYGLSPHPYARYGAIVMNIHDNTITIAIADDSRWRSGPEQAVTFAKDWFTNGFQLQMEVDSNDNLVSAAIKSFCKSLAASLSRSKAKVIAGTAYAYTEDGGKKWGMQMYRFED